MPKRRSQRRDAYQRIRDLPQFREVESWLLLGTLPREIAIWIQGQGQCTDIRESSLIRTLERYRADILPSEEERVELFAELDELARLYRNNERRLQQQCAQERQAGRLEESTRSLVLAQKDLLVKRFEIKRRLGLVPLSAST